MPVSVLTLQGVSKQLGGRTIVKQLNMQVEPGEVYGFLGPNGAGKTTTIRMIVGLAKPTEGTIRIMGHDVQHDRGAALRHVGAIVENPELYSYLTGRQNLLHFARLSSLVAPARRIDEVADLVGLADRIDEKVRRYSLGMRQRLGVAQALLAKPKLLVLDEPTNGLDPAGIREFRAMIRDLAASGMSVFVSSHLLNEIQLMCDRVAILNGGRIITEQRVEDLVSSAISSVLVRVNDVEVALQVAAAAGVPADVMAEKQLRFLMSEQAIPALVRELVARQLEVYAIEPERNSLEDAFLHLTDEPSNLAEPGGLLHA